MLKVTIGKGAIGGRIRLSESVRNSSGFKIKKKILLYSFDCS
jgi:hypothetical protein